MYVHGEGRGLNGGDGGMTVDGKKQRLVGNLDWFRCDSREGYGIVCCYGGKKKRREKKNQQCIIKIISLVIF